MATPPPPIPSPETPEPSSEESGQWPVLRVDLRAVKRSLTLQNVATFVGLAALILGAAFGVVSKVGGWWVGDAVAADLRFQDHERRITRVESTVTRVETLAYRNLEEGRARDEWHETGRKPAILTEPLPAKDGGL